MLHLASSTRYFMFTGITDMRKGFDSLCGIVTSQMKLDAFSGAVFIFMNRKRNQVKLLLWEGDGLALYHKRLEKGTYELPCLDDQSDISLGVSAHQLDLVLQGVSLKKIVYRRRFVKAA